MVLEGFCCSCKSEESMLGAGRRPRNSSIYINIYIYICFVKSKADASKLLMEDFLNGSEECYIDMGGRLYTISFKEMSQMNTVTQKLRRIRCCFPLPSHWELKDEDVLKSLKDTSKNPQEGSRSPSQLSVQRSLAARFFDIFGRGPRSPSTTTQTCDVHPWKVVQKVEDQQTLSDLQDLLNQSLLRHDGTACNCLHGSSRFQLKEAFQIKNLILWRRFQRFGQSIREKHRLEGITPEVIQPPVGNALTEFAKKIQVDESVNDRLLFHGTRTFALAEQIAKEGFDSRIANSNGLYGKGSYFASQTCKSAQYATESGMTAKASPNMLGTMLVARVAIGDPHYATGRCSDTERPPMKAIITTTGSKEWRCDSIIAQPGIFNGFSQRQSHTEVVTFSPDQAYPEYILRFFET
ncbi:unnamed protein product [Durusdinium trenchii]|uniref:Poly [ADP-ribose] polymerase n=1 Tax=Durusdinium trenchii TaxID=1381693 RepID=A0ABP0QZX7_9DINO